MVRSEFICGPHIWYPRVQLNPPTNPIDPTEPDPRPQPPQVRNPCCRCIPCELPRQVPYVGLKLRQLDDCYAGKVSDGCCRRKTNFYVRWQSFLDRLPKRYPNYDYTTYCCDDYIDQSINTDFDKFSHFKKNSLGQRRRAHLNFQWPKVLGAALGESEWDRSRDGGDDREMETCRPKYICQPRDQREFLANQVRTYQEECYSRWHQKQLSPSGFTETATLVKSRISPFRKDVSFSAPLEELPTGRRPPFKEFRDLKLS